MFVAIYGLLPGSLAWLASLCLIRHFWPGPCWVVGFILAPLVLSGTGIATLFLLRLTLPRLIPGSHSNPGPEALAFHRALERALETHRLLPLVRASYVLRWLYFRALGMKLPLTMNCALDAEIHVSSLVRSGERSTLSFQSLVSGVRHGPGQVHLGEVRIGADVFIGARSTVGPSTTLGAGAWIGISNHLHDHVIGPGERIENHRFEKGED